MGKKGDSGISSLVLDIPKGQFSVRVQNLFLAGSTNPLPISLNIGKALGGQVL
jgi:hypothetical protein